MAVRNEHVPPALDGTFLLRAMPSDSTKGDGVYHNFVRDIHGNPPYLDLIFPDAMSPVR
jgi:hypothetical protein